MGNTTVVKMGTTFSVDDFDTFESKSSAFDYLCDCLTKFVETRRVRDRIYVLGKLEPAHEYKGDFRYWITQAFGLDGSITEKIQYGDKLYTINTNRWIVEVQPLTKCLTMRLSHATKIRHGL
jgi:hypothetical protein